MQNSQLLSRIDQALITYFLVSCISSSLLLVQDPYDVLNCTVSSTRLFFCLSTSILIKFNTKLFNMPQMLILIAFINKILLFIQGMDNLFFVFQYQIDHQFIRKKFKNFPRHHKAFIALAEISWLALAAYRMRSYELEQFYLGSLMLIQIIPELVLLKQDNKKPITSDISFSKKMNSQRNIEIEDPLSNHQLMVTNRKRLKSGTHLQLSKYNNIQTPEEAYDNLFQPIPVKESVEFQSGDINKFMNRITTVNRDEKSVIKEIRSFQEKVWKIRMNGIPIGLAIIPKETKKASFINNQLNKLLKKSQLGLADLGMLLVEGLKFKLVDHGHQLSHSNSRSFMMFQSMQSSHDQKQKVRRLSDQALRIRFGQRSDNEENLDYTLMEALFRLEQGEFEDYMEENNCLELMCSFQSQGNKMIHLDCRILNIQEAATDQEYTIIIQDYTKQKALSKLEEQYQFKTKIISSFSHELRTPLNSATLFLRAATMEQKLDQDIKMKYLLPALSSLTLQSTLINDIIDFSQINAGLLEITFTTFNLKDLMEDLTELFRYELTMKNMGLAFDIDNKVPMKLRSDYQRLFQVLVNMIQNAQKFSEQGYILVRVTCTENLEIRFTIMDEGVGIEFQKLMLIQSVVNQQQQERVEQQWSGFGLIISQMLLRYLSPLDSSNIDLESPGYMKGTTVSFLITNHLYNSKEYNDNSTLMKRARYRQMSLPNLSSSCGLIIKIKGKSSSKLVLSSLEKMGEENLDDSINGSSLKVIESAKNYQMSNNILISRLNTRQERSSSKQIKSITKATSLITHCMCNRLLSVDDEVFNQKSLQLLLAQIGFQVDIAFNGKQALDKMKTQGRCNAYCQGYKVILMDCNMPIMDGWEATMALRTLMADHIIPTIPIIGLTAFTSSKDIERCLDCGMIEVLSKPLQIKKFQLLLTKLKIKKTL